MFIKVNPFGKRIRNTVVWTAPQQQRYEVYYYSTCIVMIRPDVIRLCTGGMKTRTTKSRMNLVSDTFDLGYFVYQRKHMWYVRYNDEELWFNTRFNMKLERVPPIIESPY